MITNIRQQSIMLFWLFTWGLAHTALAQQRVPLPYRQGDCWGFADENRRLVIPARYDQVSFFQDSTFDGCHFSCSYAEVIRGDSMWLIGTDGKSLLPGFRVDRYYQQHIQPFSKDLFYLNVPSGTYLLHRNLYPLRYFPDNHIRTYNPLTGMDRDNDQDDLSRILMSSNGVFSPGQLCGQDFTLSPAYWNTENLGGAYLLWNDREKLYGFIDRKGQVVLPVRYHSLSNLWQGRAVADNRITKLSGRVVGRPPYHLRPYIGSNGLIQAEDTVSRRIGFVDINGELVIKPRFLQAFGFYHGLAYCQQADSSWVVIDPKGRTMLKTIPDTSRETFGAMRVGHCLEAVRTNQGIVWSEECLIVRETDHYWHVLDWNLRELAAVSLDCPPLQVDKFGIRGYLGTRDGLVVLFDHNWKVLLLPRYKSIEDICSGDWLKKGYKPSAARLLAGLQDDRPYQERRELLDIHLQPIADFDNAGACGDQKNGLVIRKNGKYGLVDSLGRLRISPEYDLLRPCAEEPALQKFGAFVACKNDRCGVLQVDGTVGLPFVFKDIATDGWKTDPMENDRCDSMKLTCHVDSCNGQWHFFNSLGLYRILPDSIRRVTNDWGEAGYSLVAHTTQHRYKIDFSTGDIKPWTASNLPDHLARLEQIRNHLADSLQQLESPGMVGKYHPPAVGLAGDNLLFIRSWSVGGINTQGVLLDTNGRVLMDNLLQIVCHDNVLSYFQDSVYREWGVPLMGRYSLRPPERDMDFLPRGEFIADFSGVGAGLFKADGTCILPGRWGQRIEYSYELGNYLVGPEGKQVIFDAENRVFRTAASRYLPYLETHTSHSEVPRGYFWVERGHKPGLVRIVDGAAFFED